MTSIKGVLFLKNVDGEMKWVNGDSGNEGKYEGEIENWKPNGIGNITYLIGIKYVGKWKDGREWNGTGYNKNGEIVVRFVNGKQIEQ